MHLDRVMSVAECAALAGFSRRRMLRHLLRLNERSGGTLLENSGTPERPRWSLSMGALMRLRPGWFVEHEDLEGRIASLEARVTHQGRVMELHTDRLVLLRVER